MGSKSFGTGLGAAAVIAVAASVWVQLSAASAWAQLSTEPYSYRSGGSVGMSNAYRQAMMDKEITGSRPRNLLRGADGSLLVVEERNSQAVVTTRPSNYLFTRGGNVAGVNIAGAGYGLGFGSPVDGWTGPGVALTPPGAGRPPIDSWVAQVDGVRPVQ